MFSPGDPEKAPEAFHFKCLNSLFGFCYQNPDSTSIEQYGQTQRLVSVGELMFLLFKILLSFAIANVFIASLVLISVVSLLLPMHPSE